MKMQTLLVPVFFLFAASSHGAGPLLNKCTACHSKLLTGASVHNPVKGGECETCHAPDEKKKGPPPRAPKAHPFFKKATETKEVNELCLQCHDKIDEQLKKSSMVHSAVSDSSCTACHDPHHSKFARLLKNDVPKLCFGCHDTIEATIKESKHKHSAPVAECTSCHNPHASSNRALLKQVFTDKTYIEFDEKNYALCFGCHDSGLATKKNAAEEDTKFRNGNQNLHYLHIHDKKWPRSCRTCHEPHASSNPNLIRKSMSYGKYELPIIYWKTADGGGCAAMCHKSKIYDRSRAATNAPGR